MIKDTKHSFYLRSLYYNSCVIVAVIFWATWQLFKKKRSIIHQIGNASLFVIITLFIPRKRWDNRLCLLLLLIFFSITWQKRTRSPADRCSGNEPKLPPTTPLLGKQKDGIWESGGGGRGIEPSPESVKNIKWIFLPLKSKWQKWI